MLDNQLHGAPSELVKILHYSFKRRLEIEAVRRAVITGDSLVFALLNPVVQMARRPSFLHATSSRVFT